MGKEWIIPLLVAGGLAISGCSSAPSASPLETPHPDAVGTASTALRQTAAEAGVLRDSCTSSLNPNCQRQVPSVDSAVDKNETFPG